jgi:hypothetical protein
VNDPVSAFRDSFDGQVRHVFIETLEIASQ